MVKFTKRNKNKGMVVVVAQNKKTEELCCFYVSDFHLEMILIPYINKKLKNNEEIKIVTEKNLKETVKILISKMNLDQKTKEEILELGWDNINSDISNNTNIIIIGSKKYIEEKNSLIENSNIENINVVNCYEFDEVKDEMNEIVEEHDNTLNTLGN